MSFVTFSDGTTNLCGTDAHPRARLDASGSFELELAAAQYQVQLTVSGHEQAWLLVREPITLPEGTSTWTLDERWSYVHVFGRARTSISLGRNDGERSVDATGSIPASGRLVMLFCAGDARLRARDDDGEVLLDRDLQLRPNDWIEIPLP